MEIRLVSNTDYAGLNLNDPKTEFEFWDRYSNEPFIVYINGKKLEGVSKFQICLDKEYLADNECFGRPWKYTVEFTTQSPVEQVDAAWHRGIPSERQCECVPSERPVVNNSSKTNYGIYSGFCDSSKFDKTQRDWQR